MLGFCEYGDELEVPAPPSKFINDFYNIYMTVCF